MDAHQSARRRRVLFSLVSVGLVLISVTPPGSNRASL